MSLDDDLQKYDFVQSVLSDLRRITLKENGFTEKTWAGLKSDLANAVVDGTATEHGTIQIVETPAYLHKSSQAIGTRKEIRLIRKERT